MCFWEGRGRRAGEEGQGKKGRGGKRRRKNKVIEKRFINRRKEQPVRALSIVGRAEFVYH